MPAIRPNAEIGGAAADDASLARDLKRDFYKYLDRFGSRPDLFGGPDHDSGLSPEDPGRPPNVFGARVVIQSEASRSGSIVPPAVRICEASFHVRATSNS